MPHKDTANSPTNVLSLRKRSIEDYIHWGMGNYSQSYPVEIQIQCEAVLTPMGEWIERVDRERPQIISSKVIDVTIGNSTRTETSDLLPEKYFWTNGILA